MKKIKKVQTKDYIAELLRNEIFSGNIADGEKITQESIAKKLGVSRMPVREALQLLEQEGFLQRLPNRHMQVNGPTRQSVLYNFRILSSLETEIAQMVLHQGRDATPIEKAFKDLETSQVDESYIDKVVTFHQQISVQLGDQYIKNLHEKTITGYFAFALKHLPELCKHSAQTLKPILETMKAKEDKDLRIRFDEYFMEFAYAMIKEGHLE